MNNEKDTIKDRVEKQSIQPAGANQNGALKMELN